MSHNLNLDHVLTEADELEIQSLDLSELENLESEEQTWLKAKGGKLSVSEFHRLMGYEDKITVFPAGAETYVIEKVMQIVTENPTPKSIRYMPQIIWGKMYEKEANQEFQKATGIVVDFYGHEQKFIQISEYVGLTPDGLIGIDGGVETKCPDSHTHYHYMRNLNEQTIKKLYPEVYWQIQGSMHLTNRQYWYFVSYDPRYKDEKKRLYYFKVNRNEEDIEKLKRRLFMATQSLKKHLEYFHNN